ncbi:hypothetical protein, partial [Endozoicomonas sp. ONNA1]|uniref:hypothetical protein n=1 Tax=Endozoicomonas sp. ONNA1 TaxID=2828740 RepID=UPI00214977DA
LPRSSGYGKLPTCRYNYLEKYRLGGATIALFMPRYSKERKSAVLQKLLPPDNRSVTGMAREPLRKTAYGHHRE